jgi:hypothetical protein
MIGCYGKASVRILQDCDIQWGLEYEVSASAEISNGMRGWFFEKPRTSSYDNGKSHPRETP